MSNYDQIKNYFLGNLPEADQLKMEEEYFSGPESLLAFWADANDLIDDYLQGKLSRQEHQLFKQRLNQLPALRENIETDRALMQALTLPQNQNYQRIPESTRRWSLLQWWSGQSFPAQASAMVILLGIMGASVWYSLTPEKNRIAKQEIVKDESPSPSPEKIVPSPVPKVLLPQSSPKSVKPTINNHPAPVIASFLLSAEVLRGNEAVVILPIAAEVTTLRLQLELNADGPKRLGAVLQTSSGDPIKSWESLPVVYQKETPLLLLNLSAAGIEEREYVIKVSGAQTPQEFHFRIQKNNAVKNSK